MGAMGFEWCLERRVGFGCAGLSCENIPDTREEKEAKAEREERVGARGDR